jgi:hypothetical protein
MFNFVQVKGQFRRIAELDKIYFARRARGMDAPSQSENFKCMNRLSISRLKI